ncbi:glycoside hydrolase family 31 protein [Kluyvera intermedia]|uniref:Family 31 glucosidase n=1 Tax=Kluyvera intermedia TaxID=61648 RepID=A0ABX6DS47_KLUIN|nr:TIM-barrel domain-containing protein [Kluyvera intermedia]QGH30415.1 family 31 glucosidase [Kluyvera intermedia]QGH39397.1 family 31 glucosidase [Kluyvera intermedia]WQD28068.1 glycoside hydrolase family 31 protein [Kluyvera intermedia]VDZ83613.1 Alpha-xylosidase [Kluyvera intermedia]
MSELIQHANAIEWRFERQILRIEPWGEHSLRVRATCAPRFNDEAHALLSSVNGQTTIVQDAETLTLTHGNISAVLNLKGQLAFYNQRGELLLEEMWRQRSTVGIGASEKSQDKYVSALKLDGREFKPLPGGKYQLTVRFEARDGERFYGMGQYQQPWLDLKGCSLELAQRNSQASVPFLQSNLGYGLLWNNPAIGEAVLAKNHTVWTARVTEEMDYWITAGDSVAQVTRQYASATGTPPPAPEFISGLWQCKLRYRNQQEVLEVAREYHRRHLPLSVMVIDFFHWPNQGTWCFDPVDWPDPKAMVEELESLGIKLMVSVWPTVEARSPLFPQMKAKGWLVTSDRGVQVNLDFMGNTTFYDATHPQARQFVWETVKKNYYDLGIKLFWLDEAEPEYRAYDFDNYRYHAGPVLEVGNRYPRDFAQGFYDGLHDAGEKEIVNLVRCSWAGSQRYGVLAWSGDVHSSFHAFRNQLAAGLNMGLAGIPWWTTDIGGFQGGNIHDPAFHELLIRWFQWAVFCPVLRMHGYREPRVQPAESYRNGIPQCDSGSPNELWSYGEENYAIMQHWLGVRETLRPYIDKLYENAHNHGDPLMRPMFWHYPDEPQSWQTEDQYLFGEDLLVAPVMQAGQRQREVWLPGGHCWVSLDGERYQGGQRVTVAATLETIPLFIREGSPLVTKLVR